MSNAVRTPLAHCPVCKKPSDAASCVTSKKALRPKPGLVSMCLYCGALLRYTRTMQLRILTEREYDKVPPKTKALFAKMQAAREDVMADYVSPKEPS